MDRKCAGALCRAGTARRSVHAARIEAGGRCPPYAGASPPTGRVSCPTARRRRRGDNSCGSSPQCIISTVRPERSRAAAKNIRNRWIERSEERFCRAGTARRFRACGADRSRRAVPALRGRIATRPILVARQRGAEGGATNPMDPASRRSSLPFAQSVAAPRRSRRANAGRVCRSSWCPCMATPSAMSMPMPDCRQPLARRCPPKRRAGCCDRRSDCRSANPCANGHRP